MTHIGLNRDAYPEQLMGILRDEIRRAEHTQQARAESALRRRERWRRVRDHLHLTSRRGPRSLEC